MDVQLYGSFVFPDFLHEVQCHYSSLWYIRCHSLQATLDVLCINYRAKLLSELPVLCRSCAPTTIGKHELLFSGYLALLRLVPC